MKIYFAGSVRGGRDDQSIYAQIISLLGNFGEVLTEHLGNRNLTDEGETISESVIYRRDIDWLMGADVLVAEVTSPSLGVGYEIGRFETTGRPIICLYRDEPKKNVSAMVIGNPKVKLIRYTDMKEIQPILKKNIGPK
jgi:nucleoside 2-deoxyribosyltransferase